MNSTPNAATALPFIGRVLMATIFLLSALGKIVAPDANLAYIASMGLPAPCSASWLR